MMSADFINNYDKTHIAIIQFLTKMFQSLNLIRLL